MNLRNYFAAHAPEPGIAELAHFMDLPPDTPLETWDVSPEQFAKGVLCVRDRYNKLTVAQKLSVVARYKFAHADAMLEHA